MITSAWRSPAARRSANRRSGRVSTAVRADGFHDYFCQLTEHEPKRAAKFGLKHFCWLCINPKEAEDVKLAEEVIALIPKFLDRPNVLGIGEIGLNKNSPQRIDAFSKCTWTSPRDTIS